MNVNPHVHKLKIEYNGCDVYITYGDQPTDTLALSAADGDPEIIIERRIMEIISAHDLSFDPLVVKIATAVRSLEQKYNHGVHEGPDPLANLPRFR